MNWEMEECDRFCWFDQISDDVLLYILSLVPRIHWKHISRVCTRFRNVCHDKEIFRISDLSCAYGLTERDLSEYLNAGSAYIETLNLNHCYWFTSTTLSTYVARCKKVQHISLLDCKLTIKGLSKILCSIECLKSLVISVSNLLEFSNAINDSEEVQTSVKHLKHFVLHTREESNGYAANSLRFHLSQQTTLFEYCPNLESFCVIGTPCMCQKFSKRLIHPLIVKTDHLTNLKTMSINCTEDATSRLYFFGILVKAFELPGIRFTNLSVSGLDLKQAVKRSYFIRCLQESWPTLKNLDLSKVHIDELEASISIEEAPCLTHLNLADIRSESRCLGLLASASRCKNLVSLNLRGATSGCKIWSQDELHGLDSVLESCRNLQHLNLSGLHVHETDSKYSLIDVLTRHNISAFKSLALSVCCVAFRVQQACSKSGGYISKGHGKRQRVSRLPQASTSSCVDTAEVDTELSRLHKACPGLTSLELINTGFHQSAVICKLLYTPCMQSYKFLDSHLIQLSKWKQLTYLQLTGLPGINSSQCLKQIAECCVKLEVLHLAYFGLGTQTPAMWAALQHFKQLRDLRIEQQGLRLDDRFYLPLLQCEKLLRLVIVANHSRVDSKALENYVEQATTLYVIQLFMDTTLKECDRLQSVLQKRYETRRPGFLAILDQLHHERVPFVLPTLPFVHLDEITLLSSRICSKPSNTVM